jgi:hypothetical protein
LGKEHPNTLTAMNNLAGTLYAQGDLAGARKLQEQVLEASARLLGKEHSYTLTAILNLAGTLKAEKSFFSNFRRLCGSFFRGSARFRSKKAP